MPAMQLVGAPIHLFSHAKQLCDLKVTILLSFLDKMSLPWLTFNLLHNIISFSFTAFLRCFWICCPLIDISGACELLQDGSEVFQVVPSSSANLWASLTSRENPLAATLSSKCCTILIMVFELSYNLTATLILISLYSHSLEHRPLPPFSLGK